MATAEYIGALISLISKSDIRYQGLLASINPEQATIALEKVRSWGTEGRILAQGRPQEEIPPSDHVYDYIMFRAADVKDLKIDDPNPPKEQAAPQPALNDPAILNSSAPPSGPGGFAPPPAGMYGMMPPPPFGAAPYPGAAGFRPPSSSQFNAGGGVPPQQPPMSAAPTSTASNAGKVDKPATSPHVALPEKVGEKTSADKVLEEMAKLSVSKPAASTQASTSPSSLPPAAHHLPAIPHAAAAAANAAAQSERRAGGAGGSRSANQNNNGRHRAQHNNDVGGPSMPSKEFDFESANAKFQKHKEAGATSAEAGGSNAAPSGQANGGGLLDAIPPPSSESPGNFYDRKTGFFDNISSEIKERYERSDPRSTGGAPAGGEDGGSGFFDSPGGRGGRGGRGGGGRGRGRANRMAEEAKNMQTFGDTGASVGGGYSGGRGRGGRGGRGGYRGRGRGTTQRHGDGAHANGSSHTAPMRMA